ncbi:MAG: hypothetical protein WC374_03745 [Phycisphaerae bacterium]
MKTIMVYKKTSIIGVVLALFLLLIFNNISYGNSGTITQMPESEYAEFLDNAADVIKANYEKICTWQGEISIHEDNYYYDGKWGELFQIDINEPAFYSNSIRRNVSQLEKFMVDVRNNKLYTECEMPIVKFKALDLDRDFVAKGKYSPVISIVTSDEYLSYEPNIRYGYETIIDGKAAGSAAFRSSTEKARNEQWAGVRDPRRYFFTDNKKTVWEDLQAIRNYITTPPPDIPPGKAPQINITTEDMGDHTKTHIKAGFHGSPDCSNCENAFVYIIMTLDSSVGLNLVRREVTDEDGNTLQTLDITYEKIGNIYVPKTIHFVIFNKFDSWITFTKSILNAPIPAEKFNYMNLGLKNDDRLIDKVAGKEFKIQNSELVEISPQKAED